MDLFILLKSADAPSSVDVAGPKPEVPLAPSVDASGALGKPGKSSVPGIPAYDEKYNVMYWQRGGSANTETDAGNNGTTGTDRYVPTREDYTDAMRRYSMENMAPNQSTASEPVKYRDYVGEAMREYTPTTNPSGPAPQHPQWENPQDVFDERHYVKPLPNTYFSTGNPT